MSVPSLDAVNFVGFKIRLLLNETVLINLFYFIIKIKTILNVKKI